MPVRDANVDHRKMRAANERKDRNNVNQAGRACRNKTCATNHRKCKNVYKHYPFYNCSHCQGGHVGCPDASQPVIRGIDGATGVVEYGRTPCQVQDYVERIRGTYILRKYAEPASKRCKKVVTIINDLNMCCNGCHDEEDHDGCLAELNVNYVASASRSLNQRRLACETMFVDEDGN